MILTAFKMLEQHDKKNHTFSFGFVDLYIGFLPLLNLFFVLLHTEATSLTPAKIQKMLGFFSFTVAHLLSLYPLLCIHPQSHTARFLEMPANCSLFMVNKRPHTTHYFPPCLCSQSCICRGKDNWVCVVKSQMLSSSCLGSIPTSQQMYEYFPRPPLQIRTCILPKRTKKFQTQILENEEQETHGIE